MKHPYIRLAAFGLQIKKELLFKVLLQLLILLTYVGQAFALSYGTAGIFSGGSLKSLLPYYLAAVGCIVLRGWMIPLTEGYSKKVAGQIKESLRNQLVGKLIELGPSYGSIKPPGRLQSLVTDGVEYVEPYLVDYLPQLLVVAVATFLAGAYLLSLTLKAGLLMILSLLVALLMPHLMMPFIKQAAMGYWKGYAVLNTEYVDAMQGMNTLKVLGASKKQGQALLRQADAFRSRQIHWTRFSLISSAVIALMMTSAKTLTTGIAALETAQGMMTAAQLLTILFLSAEWVRPVKALDEAWHASYLGLSVAQELFEILDAPLPVTQAELPLSQGLEEGIPSLTFDQVTFSYPTRKKPALREVSFTVKPGESVAIVGKSGSGKSTLAQLLLRFYDVSQGSIRINGTDIRSYDLAYLRSKIAVVFQDTYLFHGTVAENIAMAKEEATEAEIYRAARLANAHQFIAALPQGYQTLVGERGATLSGGERQRIAIARAILKEAPLLILDEATASLDGANEESIREALADLKHRHTSLIIAHRLSAIQQIPLILVFDQGVLKEAGSHQALLAGKGIYFQLWEAQAKRGISI